MYQLYCEDMQPDGVGALYLAFEQLKKKLGAKGYFDPERKRPIKQLPETLAVITAETGAALQDILNIITRRYPLVKIKLLPVLVQGETAPQSIAKAFAIIQKQGSGLRILLSLPEAADHWKICPRLTQNWSLKQYIIVQFGHLGNWA